MGWPRHFCRDRGTWKAWSSGAVCVLGRRYRWLRPLARRVLDAFAGSPRPRVARLAEFLREDKRFPQGVRARDRCGFALRGGRLRRWCRRPGRRPPGRCRRSPRPPSWPGFWSSSPTSSTGSPTARPAKGLPSVEALRHYRYRWVAKPSGSLRLIEAPKPRLKQLQRRLLDEILLHIPPHEAAHGFRPGRSVMSFVAPHVGRTIVLKMDLRDFFVSITSARVMAIYLTAGYPEPVARLLTGLCTNTVPLAVWNQAGPLAARPVAFADRLAGPAAVPPAAPAAGCPHIAGPGQPGRPPARRAAGRPGQGGRGQLHPLCRRPGFLRRRVVRHGRSAGSRSTSRRSHSRRASPSSTARRESCARGSGNARPEW